MRNTGRKGDAVEIDYGQSLTEEQEDALGAMIIETKLQPVIVPSGVAFVGGRRLNGTEMRLAARWISKWYGLPQGDR